jgi:hypothetical protein
VNVYGTTWPAAVIDAVVDDLTTWIDGVCTAVTVACALFELVAPACAVAVFVTEPASTSACVIVYEAVQVIVESGAMSPAGQDTVALSSVTVIGPVMGVVFELFVTEYV